jgi:hypothetical protein
MRTWVRDKEASDAAERQLANWFRECGWEPLRTTGRGDVDLVIQSTVEVKLDRIAPTSGNAAIEVGRNGRDGGVLTSRAAYWAIVAGSRAVLVRTVVLRKAIESGCYRRVPAGDRGATTICLVPWRQLERLPGAQSFALKRGKREQGRVRNSRAERGTRSEVGTMRR